MAQLGRQRKDDQRADQALSGPKVWLESCSSCGRPVTVVAAAKPEAPRCAECGPAPEADPGADPEVGS